MTTSKNSTLDALLSVSEIPSDMILEGLYKSKLQDSVQLETVLTLYDQETVQNNGQTSYLRLKTSVKLHFDHMVRIQNFRVRGKRSHHQEQNGKKADVERKVGECFQWKAHRQRSKGDSCSQTEKDDRLLPHQIRIPRLTKRERKSSKTSGNGEESSSDIRSEIRVSRLQVSDSMQIWKNMFLQTC